MPRALRIPAAVLACALAVLAACQRSPKPVVDDRPDGPAATVRHLATQLRQYDLAGFARDAVPAQDYQTFAAGWAAGASRWPLSELPLPERLVPMLAALSANDAERQLGIDYDRNLAGQVTDLRNAAQTLGLFIGQYVRSQGEFTPDQRAHFGQVVPALTAWAQSAPLADAPRAHTALRTLVPAARATGIDSEADLTEAGMAGALTRLDPFFAALGGVLADYGLSLDDSLAKLEVGEVTQEGDLAKVAVTYPLAGKPIQLTVTLRRQDGHWYVAHYMDQAAALRKRLEQQAPTAPDAPNAPAPEAPSPSAPPASSPPPPDGKVAGTVTGAGNGHWA